MPPSHRSSRQTPDSRDAEEDDMLDLNPVRATGNRNIRRIAIDFIGRWYWIALGGILGVLAASYYLSKTPKLYAASSSLLIKQQTASVMMSANQVEEIDLRSMEAMNTVAERIRRTDLIERVASRQDVRELQGLVSPAIDWLPAWLNSKLGRKSPGSEVVDLTPPAAPVLSRIITSWLTVSIRRGTRLIDITIIHRVPEVAKALADAVAREYLAEIANTRNADRSKQIDLLENESKQARSSIQAARDALSIYARTLEVHKTLDTKESDFEALGRRYLPKHPKIITATIELKQLREQFIREFEGARQAASDKVYWDIASKELPDRQSHPEDFLHAARQLLLARIGVLESETASATTVYNTMLTRIKETSVNKESTDSSADINNLARVPDQPSAPLPSKVFAVGTMGGLGCGVLLAFLLIRLDNRYHTVSQISLETGVTVLGAIADIKLHHLEVAERQYRKRNPYSPADLHSSWDKRLVFRPGVSSTSYAEMYRVMRASISLLGDESKRKITLFTSSLPGEGKSLTSTNFAIAAAGQGRKTLLIDMDLRKPSIHRFFGLTRTPDAGGLTECLANLATFDSVVIRETAQPNLHLILGGKSAPNPGELLESGRLHELLAQACKEYDVVVLDTAPLLAVPDTRIIAPFAHNLCLVTRAEYTPKGAIQRTLQILSEDGSILCGLIFNGFVEKRRLMGENYSYGYYKTSRYGRSYRYGYGKGYGAYGSEPEKRRKK